MANYINEIFQIGGSPIFVVNTGTLVLAVISGIIISIITGLYPALKARSINIVEVLRGIKPYKEEKLSKKGFYFGWLGLFISIEDDIFLIDFKKFIGSISNFDLFS